MPLFVWAALLDCCMEVLRLAWRNDPDLVARWLEYSEKTKVVPNLCVHGFIPWNALLVCKQLLPPLTLVLLNQSVSVSLTIPARLH